MDKSVFLRKNDSGVPRFSWNTKSSAACSSQFYSWENESAFEKNTATQQVVKIHELLYSQLIHEEKKIVRLMLLKISYLQVFAAKFLVIRNILQA